MAKIHTLHVRTPKGFMMPLHFDVEDEQQQEDFQTLEIALSCPETSFELHKLLAQELEVFRFRCRSEFVESMEANEKRRPVNFSTAEELKNHQIQQDALIEDAVQKVSSYWLYAGRQLKDALDEYVIEHDVLEKDKTRRANQASDDSVYA